MRIRISVVLLAMLGVAAALSAAVLTATLRVKPVESLARMQNTETKILVAAKALSAMSVVDTSAIQEQMVPAAQAPQGFYSEPSQITGKFVSVPIVEGQAFTANLFPPEGSGWQVAGRLPEGKRAVSVSLKDHSGLFGLLYPGCRVDVIGTFEMSPMNKEGKAVSSILLENIEVLAVEDLTVGESPSEAQQEKKRAANDFTKRIMVTLMVDADQAKALQLGVEQGSISLAMRNPKDAVPGSGDATLLSDGRLAQLAKLLAPTTSAEKPSEDAPPPPPPPRPKKEAPQFTVNIVRGVASETVSFSKAR